MDEAELLAKDKTLTGRDAILSNLQTDVIFHSYHLHFLQQNLSHFPLALHPSLRATAAAPGNFPTPKPPKKKAKREQEGNSPKMASGVRSAGDERRPWRHETKSPRDAQRRGGVGSLFLFSFHVNRFSWTRGTFLLEKMILRSICIIFRYCYYWILLFHFTRREENGHQILSLGHLGSHYSHAFFLL